MTVRAIVFGQSGLDRRSYLEAVRAVAAGNGKRLTVLSIGERMALLDPGRRDPQLFPTLPLQERDLLRRQALTSILEEIGASPAEDYVVSAHAVFKVQRGLVPEADFDLLRDLEPRIIVVLLDDFHFVHRRLQSTTYRRSSLADVLAWRDAELAVARTIASRLCPSRGPGDWRFFVLARGHSPEVLYRLLYECHNRTRIYASFPITGASAEQKNEILAFKKRLSRDHIVFDPYKIAEGAILHRAETFLEEMSELCRDSLRIRERYAELISTARAEGVAQPGFSLRDEFQPSEVLPGLTDVEYVVDDFAKDQREDNLDVSLLEPYRFALDELESIKSTVNGQILSRDYMLIDQSDVVCAFIPWDGELGRAMISAGSQTELTYAEVVGRERIVLSQARKSKLSPFVKDLATCCRTIEEVEEALAQRRTVSS